jgi:DNA-binding NtrC family response regulator
MSPANRNLIVFPRADSTEIRNTLESCQWRVFIALSLHQARDLIATHTFYVGFYIIDPHNDEIHLEQIRQLFNYSSQIKWIIGAPKDFLHGTANSRQERILISRYCHDYLTLPVNMELMLYVLGHAHGMAQLASPEYQNCAGFSAKFGIIGESPVMRNLYKQIEKISKEDSSILIEGETGTGKELIAHAIHNHSRRSNKPLIAINCGAFSDELIHAELFGYEKDAFTGAQERRIGCIEAAQGGTLFLDNIGDLSKEQQANLLRFLEERTIIRIGGIEKTVLDVRIIAADADLKAAVREGKFRKDLYYRLRELQLKIPPLRTRVSDIKLLARHFFNKFSSNRKYTAKGFSQKALCMLQHHSWLGNIRELMNCIHHAVIMSEHRLLMPSDLGLETRSAGQPLKTLAEARTDAYRETVRSSLYYSNYDASIAAKKLGISHDELYRLIKKYDLGTCHL